MGQIFKLSAWKITWILFYKPSKSIRTRITCIKQKIPLSRDFLFEGLVWIKQYLFLSVPGHAMVCPHHYFLCLTTEINPNICGRL